MKAPDNSYAIVFDDAIEQYGDMIYRICLTITGNAEDAKDAFQETFLRLVKNKDKITCEEHLKAWLIRVASNCAKSAAGSTWNRTTQGFSKEAVCEKMVFADQLADQLISDGQAVLRTDYDIDDEAFYEIAQNAADKAADLSFNALAENRSFHLQDALLSEENRHGRRF